MICYCGHGKGFHDDKCYYGFCNCKRTRLELEMQMSSS